MIDKIWVMKNNRDKKRDAEKVLQGQINNVQKTVIPFAFLAVFNNA